MLLRIIVYNVIPIAPTVKARVAINAYLAPQELNSCISELVLWSVQPATMCSPILTVNLVRLLV